MFWAPNGQGFMNSWTEMIMWNYVFNKTAFYNDAFYITVCIKLLTVTLLSFTQAYNKYLVLKPNIEQHRDANSRYNKHR